MAPPLRPVPVPRPTTGTPAPWASAKTRLTASVLAGKTTAMGIPRSTDPSYSKTSRSSEWCTTFSSPTMLWRRAKNSLKSMNGIA